MEGDRFDGLTRKMASLLSRRTVARGVAGVAGAAALGGLLIGSDADAKKKKKKDCRKKGCPAPSNPCQVATCTRGKKKKNGRRRYTCVVSDAADGVSCGTDKICQSGTCYGTCPENSICGGGQTCCNNACVNINSDFHYCGSCNAGCNANTADKCAGGQCKCGSGSACTGGKICTDGGCACPEGQTDCSGTCVDLRSDNDNCGACGRECASNTVCRNGILCEAASCLASTDMGGTVSLAADGGVTATVIADPSSYGAVQLEDIPEGATFADLTSLSATYDFSVGSCGAGTPRFVVYVDDNGTQRCPYVQFPLAGPCGSGGDGSTGQLIGLETPYTWIDDLCGMGGNPTNTYSNVLARYANAPITRIVLVADSSHGAQTVTFNPCAKVSV